MGRGTPPPEDPVALLSDREREVLALLAEGLRNRAEAAAFAARHSAEQRAQPAAHERAHLCLIDAEHDGDAARGGAGEPGEGDDLALVRAHRRERVVRGHADREQHRALDERSRIAAARGDHHPLGHLLGDRLVARGGEGRGVDAGEHLPILGAWRDRVIDRTGEPDIVRTDDQARAIRSCEGMHRKG